MKPSFNISKLTPPQTPKVLYRYSIFNLLEKNWDKKLIFVFMFLLQKDGRLLSFRRKHLLHDIPSSVNGVV